MKEVKAIIQPFMLNHVLNALHQIEGLPGATIAEVRSVGLSDGRFDQITKIKLEIMVADHLASQVVEAIQNHAHTGKPGDGRVFVIPVEDTVKIQTGEHDYATA